MRSQGGIGGVAREVGWLVVLAVCLTAAMVLLGYVVTDLLPSTAIGRWDADVPRRLLEYRQHDEDSESKIITTLSSSVDKISPADHVTKSLAVVTDMKSAKKQ